MEEIHLSNFADSFVKRKQSIAFLHNDDLVFCLQIIIDKALSTFARHTNGMLHATKHVLKIAVDEAWRVLQTVASSIVQELYNFLHVRCSPLRVSWHEPAHLFPLRIHRHRSGHHVPIRDGDSTKDIPLNVLLFQQLAQIMVVDNLAGEGTGGRLNTTSWARITLILEKNDRIKVCQIALFVNSFIKMSYLQQEPPWSPKILRGKNVILFFWYKSSNKLKIFTAYQIPNFWFRFQCHLGLSQEIW